MNPRKGNPLRVIGIDPGSRFTGYGIIEKRGNTLTTIASGRIVAGSSSVPLAQRLSVIYTELDVILKRYEPEFGAIEGIFHARNAMSSLKLGHARGVAMLTLELHNITLHEYPPASVKQAVTGNGRSSKDNVERMVRMLLSIQGDLAEDESDALSIAICHCNTINFKRRLK